MAVSVAADISEWFGIATNLAFRDNPFGQEVRGAPSFGWGLRPRSGMYLLNVYLIVKIFAFSSVFTRLFELCLAVFPYELTHQFTDFSPLS
jgi:hypothetical protein